MSVSITIRNIDDSTVHWLENKAMHQGIDIESVVLQLIQMEMKKEQKVSEFFVSQQMTCGLWRLPSSIISLFSATAIVLHSSMDLVSAAA